MCKHYLDVLEPGGRESRSLSSLPTTSTTIFFMSGLPEEDSIKYSNLKGKFIKNETVHRLTTGTEDNVT